MSSTDRPVDSIPNDAGGASSVPRLDSASAKDVHRGLPATRSGRSDDAEVSASAADQPEVPNAQPVESAPSWDVPHAPTSASLRTVTEALQEQQQQQQRPQSPPTRTGVGPQRPTSPRRGEASEQPAQSPSGGEPKQSGHDGLGISLPRVLGGAFAAATAAVASSVLGVAGTLIGGVLASVVISVGTALYTRPIERTHQVLKETIPPRLERSRGSASGDAPKPTGATSLQRLRGRFSSWADAAKAAGVSPRRRWGAVALSAAAMAVLAFVMLTGLEDVTGRPVSAWTGHGSDSGTTLGHLFGQGWNGKSHNQHQGPHRHKPNGGQQTTANPPGATQPTAPTTAPATTPTTAPTTTTVTTPTSSTTAPTQTVSATPTGANKAPPTTSTP